MQIRSINSVTGRSTRILTGQQPVVFLQFEAVENPLDVLQLLLFLLLQFFLQGSAAFLLLLFLIQRLYWKENHNNIHSTQSATSLALLCIPPIHCVWTDYSLSPGSPRWP